MVSKNVQILFGECIGIFLFLTVALGKSFSWNLIICQYSSLLAYFKIHDLGSVAQLVLGTNGYFDICVGFALGAAIGIFTAANLSGKI